jgi:hypothetical protein
LPPANLAKIKRQIKDIRRYKAKDDDSFFRVSRIYSAEKLNSGETTSELVCAKFIYKTHALLTAYFSECCKK